MLPHVDGVQPLVADLGLELRPSQILLLGDGIAAEAVVRAAQGGPITPVPAFAQSTPALKMQEAAVTGVRSMPGRFAEP